SSRRRHTSFSRDWSSDVCSSDLSRTARPVALRILAAQLLILVPLTLIGRPELYLFLWFAPWMTVWRVLNRLRAIAEHGGMTASRSEERRVGKECGRGWALSDAQ